MPNKTMLMKTTWYPRPHNMITDWGYGLETAVANADTIVPITMYDEGLGAPSAYEANPEHASFVEAAEANCFPDSRINMVVAELTMSLTKAALETDKIHNVKYYFQPVFTTFDDITALDEISTLDIGELLELQREGTDRQSYPLYNAIDMVAGSVGTTTVMPANLPGLT